MSKVDSQLVVSNDMCIDVSHTIQGWNEDGKYSYFPQWWEILVIPTKNGNNNFWVYSILGVGDIVPYKPNFLGMRTWDLFYLYKIYIQSTLNICNTSAPNKNE